MNNFDYVRKINSKRNPRNIKVIAKRIILQFTVSRLAGVGRNGKKKKKLYQSNYRREVEKEGLLWWSIG